MADVQQREAARQLSCNEQKPTGIKPVVIEQICALAEKYALRRVILFGSRARGDFRPKSDIDLAAAGGNIDAFRLAVEEETDTLLTFDVVNLDTDIQPALRDAIDKEGRIIYEKVQ